MVARYGGEEFAIILAGTEEAGCERVIARVQKAIWQLAILHAQSDVAATLTVSIGVSTHIPTANQASASLIESADRTLYQAKQNGRNQHRRHVLESDQVVSSKQPSGPRTFNPESTVRPSPNVPRCQPARTNARPRAIRNRPARASCCATQRTVRPRCTARHP